MLCKEEKKSKLSNQMDVGDKVSEESQRNHRGPNNIFRVLPNVNVD